jgi:hypothetical protein
MEEVIVDSPQFKADALSNSHSSHHRMPAAADSVARRHIGWALT